MKLKIKDNYLYQGGTPFFWLGDTAWLLFEKLTIEEAKLYLDQRKELGFNVIQCVLLHTYKDGFFESGRTPNSMKYWDEVLEIVLYARKLNLIMGILPAWGAMVKNQVLTLDNIDSYAEFLIRIFSDFDHIVWILGGDIRGNEYFDFYDHFGKKLKQANPLRLITFHPFGRTGSYEWFSNCCWLDFHMFQSGHRRYDQIQMNAWDDKRLKEDYFGEDNYKYVLKNQSIIPFKPCLDGEPSYEGILQGLHDESQPYWQAKDVRRYAYWSVLEGACGFTYGNNSIMQFYKIGDIPSYGVKEEWKDALFMPGSGQMKYIKQIFEKFDFTKGRAMDELVVNPKLFYEHIACFGGKDYVICYSYLGKQFSLNLENYLLMKGYWMNPENGNVDFIGIIEPMNSTTFFPPKRENTFADWVLILVNKDEEFNFM